MSVDVTDQLYSTPQQTAPIALLALLAHERFMIGQQAMDPSLLQLKQMNIIERILIFKCYNLTKTAGGQMDEGKDDIDPSETKCNLPSNNALCYSVRSIRNRHA